MVSYFRIRLLQLGRTLREAGVVRIAFLIGLAIFLCLMLKAAFVSYKLIPLYIVGAIMPLVHLNRKDIIFIKTSLKKAAVLLAIEYYILLSPLLILIAFTADIAVTLSCILYIPLVSSITAYRLKNKRNKKVASCYAKILPTCLYEWLSGFRKNPLLFLVYIAGLACSFLPFMSSVCIWIITMIIGSFYTESEPLLLILKDEMNERRFIKKKIGYHLLYYIVFISPIVVASLIFNSEQYLLILYALLASSIALITIITTKYATYLPQHRSLELEITLGIVLISVVLFPLMIFTLGALVVNYSRALNNLNDYLYAYD